MHITRKFNCIPLLDCHLTASSSLPESFVLTLPLSSTGLQFPVPISHSHSHANSLAWDSAAVSRCTACGNVIATRGKPATFPQLYANHSRYLKPKRFFAFFYTLSVHLKGIFSEWKCRKQAKEGLVALPRYGMKYILQIYILDLPYYLRVYSRFKL